MTGRPGRAVQLAKRRGGRRGENCSRRRELWLIALLAITVIGVGVFKPSFLSLGKFLDIAAEAAPTTIVACAATLVVVTGEIDISVGSAAGLTAGVLGLLLLWIRSCNVGSGRHCLRCSFRWQSASSMADS